VKRLHPSLALGPFSRSIGKYTVIDEGVEGAEFN
jgi:hypothetical protein